MPSRKPTSDAAQKPDGEKHTLANRLIDQVMAKLDLDQLTSTLADQLGEKLLATVNTDSLVNVLFDKYHQEFQITFTQAILDRL